MHPSAEAVGLVPALAFGYALAWLRAVPAARRAAVVDRHVLRLASAVDLRLRAATSALAAPRRAPHVSTRRGCVVVAGRQRRILRRRESGVPVRRVRARV